jgi:UDP-N-acetylmuramoyl-tripeptide--D-alanyl-D-alanine ligase
VVDELITVGERGRMIAAAACRAGLSPTVITEYDIPDPVIDYLQENLTEKDVVLVKGSRGMHLDTIVASLEYRQ